MSDLHPDAPECTAVLPWRVGPEVKHTHCLHERSYLAVDAEIPYWQCCRCDEAPPEMQDGFDNG